MTILSFHEPEKANKLVVVPIVQTAQMLCVMAVVQCVHSSK